MNLVIDFDNTIVDTDKAMWQLYREETNDMSTDYKKHSRWWYDEICPLWNRKQQNDTFKNPRFFELLEFIPDAKETLKKLKKEGHNITICTVHRREGMLLKSQWIYENLNFVDSLIIVDADMNKNNKSIIAGDILLDDAIPNLATSNCKLPICFGQGLWNKDWQGFRAKNYYEFYQIISQLNQLEV